MFLLWMEDPAWAFSSAGKVLDLELQRFWVLGKEWGQMGLCGLSGFCVHL